MKPWLISEEDMDFITHNGEWDALKEEILTNNGVVSAEDCYYKFLIARFENEPQTDCSHCGYEGDNYKLKNDTWKCKKCLSKFSITSGTFISNTKIEFYHWWRFAYLISKLKVTNSYTISQDLELSQKTTWYMLDTLRKARKQTSDTKFINGHEVLKFDNEWEIVSLLLSKQPEPVEPFVPPVEKPLEFTHLPDEIEDKKYRQTPSK